MRNSPVPRSGRPAPLAFLPLGVIAVSAAIGLAACGGAPASAAPVTPVPSGVIAIEAKEYAFIPSTVTVPAGSVTFSIRNVGNEEHEFEIFKGDTVVDEVEGIVPGLTKDLTVTLAAGDYTFLCKLNGHDQLGMKGTLTVTSG
jgi:iron uptake system component EfeO